MTKDDLLEKAAESVPPEVQARDKQAPRDVEAKVALARELTRDQEDYVTVYNEQKETIGHMRGRVEEVASSIAQESDISASFVQGTKPDYFLLAHAVVKKMQSGAEVSPGRTLTSEVAIDTQELKDRLAELHGGLLPLENFREPGSQKNEEVGGVDMEDVRFQLEVNIKTALYEQIERIEAEVEIEKALHEEGLDPDRDMAEFEKGSLNEYLKELKPQKKMFHDSSNGHVYQEYRVSRVPDSIIIALAAHFSGTERKSTWGENDRRVASAVLVGMTRKFGPRVVTPICDHVLKSGMYRKTHGSEALLQVGSIVEKNASPDSLINLLDSSLVLFHEAGDKRNKGISIESIRATQNDSYELPQALIQLLEQLRKGLSGEQRGGIISTKLKELFSCLQEFRTKIRASDSSDKSEKIVDLIDEALKTMRES